MKSVQYYTRRALSSGLEGWFSAASSGAAMLFFLWPIGLSTLSSVMPSIGFLGKYIIFLMVLPALFGFFVLARRTTYICLTVLLNKRNAWPRGNRFSKWLTSESILFRTHGAIRSSSETIRIGNKNVLCVLTLFSAILGSCGITGVLARISGGELFSPGATMSPLQMIYLCIYIIFVMPFIETALMIKIIKTLLLFVPIGWRSTAGLSGLFWATAHLVLNGVMTFPSAFWLFWLLSLLYFNLRDVCAWKASFVLIFGVHASYNGAIFLMAYLGSAWGSYVR